jgi:hypothetical protein
LITTVADHCVGAVVGQWHIFDVAAQISHVQEAIAVAQPFCLLALLVRHVDAGHLAARVDFQRRDECVHARAAAEVDDHVARPEVGQVEIVADARK